MARFDRERFMNMPFNPLIQLYVSIGKLITSSLNIDSVLKGIMEEIQIFFNPENWSLLEYDPKKQELRFLIAEGIELDAIKDLTIKKGEGIAGKVIQDGVAIFIPDTGRGMEYSRKVDERTGFVTRSIIAVPVRFRDETFGVIEIVNRKTGTPFTHEESVVLQTIADFAAIAFSNVQLYNRTLKMAHEDSLTGALNRASLNEFIADCTQAPEMKDSWIVIASLDLDRFKEINDTHGHLAGDRALATFSRETRKRLPEKARFFRIGGDEFLIALSLKEASEAKLKEKELEEALAEVRKQCEKVDPPVAFSVGIQMGPCNRIRHLLYETDILMYHQKRNSGDDSGPG